MKSNGPENTQTLLYTCTHAWGGVLVHTLYWGGGGVHGGAVKQVIKRSIVTVTHITRHPKATFC